MDTGDVVLTPGWFNHGHGHDGDAPAYWFDGLDVPLTHLFELTFFEEHPEEDEPAVPAAGALTTNELAAAALTLMPDLEPLMELLAVSVAVTDWVPAVFRVMLKVWIPALAAVKV